MLSRLCDSNVCSSEGTKSFTFRTWYRDALAGYVREMLLDPRSLSRPYIERKGLEAVVRGHLDGNRNYTTEIHKVLTLELLHRLFVNSPDTKTFGRRRVLATLCAGHCGVA